LSLHRHRAASTLASATATGAGPPIDRTDKPIIYWPSSSPPTSNEVWSIEAAN
jgi:hypothetical protein